MNPYRTSDKPLPQMQTFGDWLLLKVGSFNARLKTVLIYSTVAFMLYATWLMTGDDDLMLR